MIVARVIYRSGMTAHISNNREFSARQLSPVSLIPYDLQLSSFEYRFIETTMHCRIK